MILLYCMYFHIIFLMAGLKYYKLKFNWDALDKLSELDKFKSECEVLFNGPLDESPPNRQAGLVETGLEVKLVSLYVV